MLYSKSASGFFPFDHPAIPDDAVGIEDAYYYELLDGQSAGKVITGDKKGYPVLADPPPPSKEELAEIALGQRDRVLATAALRIAPLQDAVDLDDASDEEVAALKKWKQYRVALNRLQDQEKFPSEINWPVAPD